MAVLQGVLRFNRDQGCWPLYRIWLLLRGDRYEGFHCIEVCELDFWAVHVAIYVSVYMQFRTADCTSARGVYIYILRQCLHAHI